MSRHTPHMSDAADICTEIPRGWTELSPELREEVSVKALEALRLDGERPAQDRLRSYYDVDGNYAGASFAQLAPIEPENINATDLHATRLLSVPIGAGATRRFLDDGATRTEILDALRAIPNRNLRVADPATFAAMETFYLAVKTNLSATSTRHPDAWATASKLCARKRPELFPVRDRKVSAYLGLTRNKSYEIAWQVFRHLIGDPDVIAAIDALSDATLADGQGTRLRLDDSRLRLLDAAIWTDTLRSV
jgi:Family of unknown function (DUF6308)